MAQNPASTDPSARVTVAVVFGGRSSEHEISCVTAGGVMEALDPQRYEVVPIGITRDGRWVLADGNPELYRIENGRLPEITDGPTVVPSLSAANRDLLRLNEDGTTSVVASIDVVFPLLHGPYGEDGTIQGLLDLSDTRYVGAGVLSSAMSMDKHYMKVVFENAGIPQVPYVLCTPLGWERDPAAVRAAVAELGYPVFVKPCRAGSSMGVSKVRSEAELDAAISVAREHDPKVLVEAAIVGREIECGVIETLERGEPATSLVGEIEVLGGGHDFYDFEAKYLDNGSVRLSCPAEVDDAVAQRVRQLARDTFVAMGCEGLARVDTFVCEDGTVYVNELNTMPGFTPFSMYPTMWQRSGMTYPELVQRLIDLALTRRVGLR